MCFFTKTQDQIKIRTLGFFKKGNDVSRKRIIFVHFHSKSNNNNDNNIHAHIQHLLLSDPKCFKILIVINLLKYYNDLIVKKKNMNYN